MPYNESLYKSGINKLWLRTATWRKLLNITLSERVHKIVHAMVYSEIGKLMYTSVKILHGAFLWWWLTKGMGELKDSSKVITMFSFLTWVRLHKYVLIMWKCVELYTHDVCTFLYVCYILVNHSYKNHNSEAFYLLLQVNNSI